MRLYRTPNKENDWSDVTEVYVSRLPGTDVAGYAKLHYHGRKVTNPNVAILESDQGLLSTYHITHLRFKR